MVTSSHTWHPPPRPGPLLSCPHSLTQSSQQPVRQGRGTHCTQQPVPAPAELVGGGVPAFSPLHPVPCGPPQLGTALVSGGPRGHSAQHGTHLLGHLSRFPVRVPGRVSVRWKESATAVTWAWWPWGQSCEGGLGRALADCVHYGTESSQWPRVRDWGYPGLQKREPRPRAAAPHPQRFCYRPAATPPLPWSQPPLAHQPSAWHVGRRW